MNKRKEKKTFTIIVVPSERSRSFTIKIPYFLIKLSISILFIILIISAFFITQSYILKNINNKLLSEKEILEEDKKILSSIVDQIDNMKDEMILLENLEKKLREKLNSDSSFVDSFPDYSGTGGSIYPQNNDNENFNELLNNLYILNKQIPQRYLQINSLIIEFEKREEILLSIPSIFPTIGNFGSGFGMRNDPFTHERKMHHGIDIGNIVGTPIYSTAKGIVIFSGVMRGYGNVIEIQHNDSISTLYGHLDSILVNRNDSVYKGQQIGNMGNTGRSTSSHLHYEVRINKTPVNPLKYMPQLNN